MRGMRSSVTAMRIATAWTTENLPRRPDHMRIELANRGIKDSRLRHPAADLV